MKLKIIWSLFFPGYKCKWCRDTGVIGDAYSMAACHYCRDLKAEIKVIQESLRRIHDR